MESFAEWFKKNGTSTQTSSANKTQDKPKKTFSEWFSEQPGVVTLPPQSTYENEARKADRAERLAAEKAEKLSRPSIMKAEAKDAMTTEQIEKRLADAANEAAKQSAATGRNKFIAERDIAQTGLGFLNDPTNIYSNDYNLEAAQKLGAYQTAGAVDAGAKQKAYEASTAYWNTRNENRYGNIRNYTDYATKSQGSQEIADSAAVSLALPGDPYRIYNEIYNRAKKMQDDPAYSPAVAFVYDEEAADFYYLWNTRGPDTAKDYYDNVLKPKLNARKTAAAESHARELANKSMLGSSAYSVATNLGSSAGIIDIAAQNATNAIRRALGKPVKAIDYNTAAQLPSRITTTIREQNEGNISSPVLSFLYETGMSMADSGVMILLNKLGVPEGLTLAAMGGSAGTAAIRDAKKRGATDGQALAEGIAYGLAEAIFEKLSLDRILKATKPHGKKEFVLELLKQSFTEGSEETLTSLANNISDSLIMVDKSEIDTYARQLMVNNPRMSFDEAQKAATINWLKQVALESLAGFISGGVMGGSNQAVLSLSNTKTNVDIARRITKTNNALVDEIENAQSAQNTEGEINNGEQKQTADTRPVVETAPAAETAGTAAESVPADESAAGREGTDRSGERDADMGPRRVTFGETYRAVRDTRKQQQRAVEERAAADAAGLKEKSSNEIGLAYGTDNRTFREMTDDLLDTYQKAKKQEYAKQGVNLHYVVGLMEIQEGDSLSYARGWISESGREIYVQVDNSQFSWQQILDHEELHRQIKLNPGLREQMINDMRNDESVAPYFNQIAERCRGRCAACRCRPGVPG